MFLAGSEVLAALPQPPHCSLLCSPCGGGGCWDWGEGSHLHPRLFLGALLLWTADFIPPSYSGPRPPTPLSEDGTKNGPLRLLRTLTMCTLQVDLIYLFCEKKRQKIPYYLQGLDAVPESRKKITIETIHTLCSCTDTRRRFRTPEENKPERQHHDGPGTLFKI
uniref:Macaca fascicularis brain cDNA clone: QmoA-10021, similar to human carbohydrate (chondroitin 6) sulfotransferase 3 (CHST3), mRNA, RefSeq: NM_004273.2 n=1 Tax=Macaca fascicularis TaxID=9541 RepID=I7GP51_MACFA|nr:unnamed protein product [Macaca fascicularis]